MTAARAGRAACAAVLTLAALALYGRSMALSARHPFPSFDEVAYLDLARDFAERGGALATAGCYLRGACLEDNRHPLYMMLLAPAMRGAPADFAWAKLLNQACALALLLAVFALSTLQWGPGVGLAGAVAVALSPLTPALAATVSGDVLFAALYFAALLTLARWNRTFWGWAAFGLLAGLAYLAKGSGHFLLISALAVGLKRHGKRAFSLPHLYLAMAAFSAAAFFLLWRNVSVWGTPFHNVNSTFAWFDGRQDTWSVKESPLWGELGPLWYLREHSLSHILLRMGGGLKVAVWTLLKALALGTKDYPSWLLTGTAVFSLAAYGARARWRQGHAEEVLALCAAGGVLLLGFAWGAMGLGIFLRYLFPVAIPFFPLAAVGAKEAAARLPWRLSPARAALAARAAMAVACMIALAGDGVEFRADPLRAWGVPPRWAETSRWIRDHVDSGGFLIDIMSRYSTWDCCRDSRRIFPYGASAGEIAGFMRRKGVHFALLDQSTLGGIGGNPKFGPSDRFGPTTFLGWPRCYHDSGAPSELLVYCEPAHAR